MTTTLWIIAGVCGYVMCVVGGYLLLRADTKRRWPQETWTVGSRGKCAAASLMGPAAVLAGVILLIGMDNADNNMPAKW